MEHARTSLVSHDEWESWVQEEKRLTSDEKEEEEEEYVEEDRGVMNMKKHNERPPE